MKNMQKNPTKNKAVRTPKSLESSKTTKKKMVTIHPKHAQPYRKRHLASFFLFAAITLVSSLVLTYLLTNQQANKKSAAQFFKDLFNSSEKQDNINITSTYGFSFDLKPSMYAGALNDADGKIYTGNEMSKPRQYSTVRISSNFDFSNEAPFSGIDIIYSNDNVISSEQLTDLGGLEESLFEDLKTSGYSRLESSQYKNPNGLDLYKTTWKPRSEEPNQGTSLNISPDKTTYLTIINNRALRVILSPSLDGSSSLTLADLDSVINSLSKKDQNSLDLKPVVADLGSSSEADGQSVLDKITFTKNVYAADSKPSSKLESDEITSLYGPSTVKIYNAFCTDLKYKEIVVSSKYCKASSGTGFLVSNNGYIATNGHVAQNNTKDLAIRVLFQNYSKGGKEILTEIVSSAGIDIRGLVGSSKQETLANLVDALYNLPDSDFSASKKVDNILVCLNKESPDLEELIENTSNFNEYSENQSIKRAEIISSNFRSLDGTNKKFYASDVALLKIDGQNFPEVKLGDLSSTSQGSNMSIIGFPGNASDNGIVSSEEIIPTLTSGKVSSIKNASGSDYKVIETDTTIGHGNSGGPAFNEKGEVIGIATYTVDGSGQGDGVYNYIRDIQDLKTLASKSNVEIESDDSETQKEWESGISLFRQARYSKAIKHFEAVKSLYPQHPTVEGIIATSQDKIAAGEDVKDSPILFIALGLGLSVVVLFVVLFIILRHRKKHKIYRSAVLSGEVKPIVNPNGNPVNFEVDHATVQNYSAPGYGQQSQASDFNSVSPEIRQNMQQNPPQNIQSE